MFPWRNWYMWTTHGYSYPSIVHSLDLQVFGPLASYSSNHTLEWLPLDSCSCYFHKCCFLVLHRRSMYLFWCYFCTQGYDFLFGLEVSFMLQVGVLIEEPFPMLTLDELCSVVQNNINEAIATGKVIQARLNGKRKWHSYKHSPNGWPNT